MVFTTTGQSGASLAIGSFASNRPQFLAIGDGSGVVAVTNVNLINEVVRFAPTSTDNTTTQQVIYIGDRNSVQMSGIGLSEFSMFTESAADTGSCWSRDGFASVAFDGTNELQIQLNYETF